MPGRILWFIAGVSSAAAVKALSAGHDDWIALASGAAVMLVLDALLAWATAKKLELQAQIDGLELARNLTSMTNK